MKQAMRYAILSLLVLKVGVEAATEPDALSLRMIDKDTPQVAVGPAAEHAKGTLFWAASNLLSTASGGLALRIRLKPQPAVLWASKVVKVEPSAHTLVALTGTGGGEWFLSLWENPYVEPEKPAVPPELADLGLGASAVTENGGRLELDEAKDPEGVFVCQAGMKLFDSGMPTSALLWADVEKAGQWHHLVWTWSSVRHRLYLDGRLLAENSVLSRLEPPADGRGTLTLSTDVAEWRDFRVFRRALTDEEVAAIATAGPDAPAMPLPMPFRVWADWGRLSGRAVVYVEPGALAPARVDVTLVQADGRTLRQLTLNSFPDGLGEAACAATENETAFPPGRYYVEAIAFDAIGRELARARSATWMAEPLQAPCADYIGCRIGAEDAKVAILPPFTPIETEGAVVKTALREHRLARTGLPASIVATGEELLNGPVHVVARMNGRALEFAGGAGLANIDNRRDTASWRSETEAQGCRLQVDGSAEYDGMLRFDISLIPPEAAALDMVELIVPLREETLKLIHSVGTGFIHRFMRVVGSSEDGYAAEHVSWSYGSAKAPKRAEQGVIFDSTYLHDEHNPRRVCSFVHIGNFDRGLCWFIDNDRGWRSDPRVPNLEIVATAKTRCLRLNVAPGPSREPLRFHFYLLANPFKPLPRDWRTWSYGNAARDRLQERTRHLWWWHWSEYATGFKPYPDRYDAWRDRFADSKLIHAPFINFGVPGGSGLYSDDGKILPFTWKTHNHRPSRDFFAHWIDRGIREIGIRGVYVDEPYGDLSSFNVLAGDSAYIAADGTRQIGFRWREGRAWFRRIRQVFADNGILDRGGVWAHTTRWKGLPFFTVADMSMDGEWPQIWVTPFANYVSHYASFDMNRGYASGKAFGFVGTQMFHGNYTLKGYPNDLIASRTYLGVTLPCDVVPMSTSVEAELQRVNNIGEAAGIFDSDATSDIAATEIDGLWVAGWRHSGRQHALLYVLARNVSRSIDVSRVVQYAGLGGRVQAFDAETGVALQTSSGWRLDRELHDFAVLWVRAVGEAPPPRAADRVLQLDFDEGLDPETGGLLVPLRVASRPRFGMGRSGQALAVGAGHPPISYPIVLAPAGGTLRFALAIDRLAPVRLVGLREWMDADLSLIADQGRPALRLDVREDGKTRTATWPLSQDREWRQVSLTWRAGHFELWCDGDRLGELDEPAAPVYQSASFPAYGVVLGDERGVGGARMDDLSLHARPRDTPNELRVWLWGRAPAFQAAVWFGGQALRQEVTSVRFVVREPQTETTLASAEAVPFRGYAATTLNPAPPRAPAAPADLLQTKSAHDTSPLPGDLLDELTAPARELVVELLGSGSKEKVVLERHTRIVGATKPKVP